MQNQEEKKAGAAGSAGGDRRACRMCGEKAQNPGFQVQDWVTQEALGAAKLILGHDHRGLGICVYIRPPQSGSRGSSLLPRSLEPGFTEVDFFCFCG